jgi:hypothetical protein
MNDFSTIFYAGRNPHAIAVSKQISVDGRKAGMADSITGSRLVFSIDPAL